MGMHRGCGPGWQPNLIFAVFMIVAGILLFLANLGWLPIHNVWNYWPVIFIGMGAARITGARRPSSTIIGSAFILLGIVYTLLNTGVLRVHLRDDGWLALVFLAIGIGGLAKALDGKQGRQRNRAWAEASGKPQADVSAAYTASDVWSKHTQTDNSSTLEHFALWSSVNRRVESAGLQGGSLTSLMGNIEIDLRRSRLAEGNTAVLDTNVIMGAIKLRIPEAWRVIWNGVQVMGSFEDKTVPQLMAAAAPQLILTGFLFMGSIEVES